MRPDGRRWWMPLTFLLLAMAAGGAGTPVHAGFGATGELGFGHDTDVYRESKSRTRGSFVPGSLHLSYETLPSITTRLGVDLQTEGALYPKPNRDGSSWNIDGDAGYERRLVGGNRRFVRSPALDLSLHGLYSELHRTFFSRTAGEEFVVVVDGDTVSLRDRYNYREFGGAGDLTLRWPRSTQWSLGGELSHRNYLNDYPRLPRTDPLDYDHATWTAAIRQNLIGPFRLALSYGRESTNYDSLTARDFDGNLVPGIIQKFRYRRGDATLYTKDLSWGHAKVFVQRSTRRDPAMGYYDYTQWEVRPLLRVTLIPRTDLLMIYDFTHRHYARARVGYNPVKPLREDFDRSTSLRALYHVRTGQAVVLQLTYESTTEKNPAYTYKRTRSWLGYQFRI